MPTSTPISTVERIEDNRKLRDWTQRAMAARAGVSYSLYTKVVSGHKRPMPQFVAACGRALGMDVSELYGQPFKDQLLEDKIQHLIQPIIHTLDLYDLDPDEDVAVQDLDVLAPAVLELGDLHDAGAFGVLAQRLPGLIEEVRAAAVTTGAPEAWDLLAQSYRAVYDVGTRFGYLSLSRTAMDRCDWAGRQAGDAAAPLRAMRQYQRSLIHMKEGDYATGLKMYAAGRAMIDAVDDTPLNLAVRGQLLLGAALLSARSGAKDDAVHLVDEAGRIAERTGEQPGHYWMGWGPTNVAAHRVQVFADTDDPGRAVAEARTMQVPDEWPPSRVARLWVSLAGAKLWAGDAPGALEALHTARHAAPQAVRYNPAAKDTVAAMIRSTRYTAPRELAAFANWAGVRP
jgi:transcriptional regulator with XRE-family HTH domain